MITLEHDRLVFRFPEVHEDATCAMDFQRTLRIPDDDKDYPLPPGLGFFPLRHLDDYARRVPRKWLKRGGVVMPMYQAEAMWINFSGDYPCAVKIAAGKIDAVTGEAWSNTLNRDPQDYLVIPTQPWLDGYCVEKGIIRQFVAMPLGSGYSAEEQITGEAEHGGVQIIVYPMKAKRWKAILKKRMKRRRRRLPILDHMRFSLAEYMPEADMDMGLAPGGRMVQKIYDDPHGLDAWDQRHASRCFVTIANSAVWQAITEDRPPTKAPTAADYTRAGLPWFDYYSDAKAVKGAEILAGLKSVAALGKEKGETPLENNDPLTVENIIGLRDKDSDVVREAEL